MIKTVIKANGEREPYQKEKIINSLQKIGAERGLIDEVISFLERTLPSTTTTKDIFNKIYSFLEGRNKKLRVKYNLKKAISLLGPAGYSFEKYFSKILEHHGYHVQTNIFLKGRCLSYEIDIFASREEIDYLIECKFHQFLNKKNDIKTILYVYGRYLDLREKFNKGVLWLVTNTKFTSETIKFANCYDIKLTSWNYPLTSNLPLLIETKHLYPVTILTCCYKKVFSQLVRADIILIEDLLNKERRFLKKITSLSDEELERIIKEAEMLL
ncbi:MAG: restriction endonuclease [Patescibacteria group bacterium]|nr:restriction endonuclease [Patescibacteria group bacterium]